MATSAPKRPHQHRLTRRGLFTLGGGVAAAGVVGAGIAAFTGDGADAAQTGTAVGTATARPRALVHPGMLHNAGDLHRAKVRVAARKDPWLKGWTRLTDNRHSASTWQPRPQAVVVRGGTGQNYVTLYHDIHAAYQNALRRRIGGTEANGDTAVTILNAWSATLTSVDGNADRFLAAGLYGYQFANAAELVRDHPQRRLPHGDRHPLRRLWAWA